jgi:hypothetical protein
MTALRQCVPSTNFEGLVRPSVGVRLKAVVEQFELPAQNLPLNARRWDQNLPRFCVIADLGPRGQNCVNCSREVAGCAL